MVSAKVIQPGTIKPNKAVDIIGKRISLNPFSFDLSVFETFPLVTLDLYMFLANKAEDISLLDHSAKALLSSNVQIIAK